MNFTQMGGYHFSAPQQPHNYRYYYLVSCEPAPDICEGKNQGENIH